MEKQIYLTELATTTEYAVANKDTLHQTNHIPRVAVPKASQKKLLQMYPLENYYDDKAMKPGITLYKTILEFEERRASGAYSGPVLKMAIPETVLMIDNSCSMIYETDGCIKVQPFVSGELFYNKIMKEKDTLSPALVQSSISSISFNHSIILNTQITPAKILPANESTIYQRFIDPFYNTSNLLRLFYTSPKCNTGKINHAYKITSNSQIDEELLRRKQRLPHHYIVNTEREGSYTATLVRGKSLCVSEAMAESLLQYCEKALCIRISELVIDLTVDREKKLWFHELKGVKSHALTRLWQIGSNEQVEQMAKQNNNMIMCRMCQLQYTKQQVQRIVTNKLIKELVVHLRNRKQSLKNPPHLPKQGSSNVCQICYDLIVAQHNLINIEKEYSSLLNICQNSIERIRDVPATRCLPNFTLNDKQQMTPSNDTNEFKAWRLFFYFQKIKNYQCKQFLKQNVLTLEMKFSKLKEKFTKVINSEGECSNKLFRNSFSNCVSTESRLLKKTRTSDFQASRAESAKFKSQATTQWSKVVKQSLVTQKVSYPFQKVKVSVFYTKASQTSNLFKDSTIDVTLTINQEKFTGRSNTLQKLKNRDDCQRHSSEIFLFDEKLRHCNLELTVGLICDGVAAVDLQAMQEDEGMYFPKQPFSICSPLSGEWMQVFTQGEQLPEIIRESTYEAIKAKSKRNSFVGSASIPVHDA